MKRKDVNLIVPKSWNECSSEQLEALSELAILRDVQQQMGEEPDLTNRDYKLKAFLLLAGLLPMCRTEWYDGDAVYWFPLRRSTWWKRLFCRKIEVPIRAWQVNEWITKHLQWLDEPYNRLRSPYTEVRIGHGWKSLFTFHFSLFTSKRVKCLDDRMTDCTYRQYISLENIVKQYWIVQRLIKQLSMDGASAEAMKNQIKNLDELRRMFLATMLSPAVRITSEERNGQTVRTEKVSYQFDEAQIAENKGRFSRRQVERMFSVCLQFYLSVQRYFSTIYPNLYVQREDEETQIKMPDFVRMEIESMSTIMKYQGFADYRAIYDSDAVHILRVLDNMSHEAKLARQNAPKV